MCLSVLYIVLTSLIFGVFFFVSEHVILPEDISCGVKNSDACKEKHHTFIKIVTAEKDKNAKYRNILVLCFLIFWYGFVFKQYCI